MTIKMHRKESARLTMPQRPISEHMREEIQQLAYRRYCQGGYEHGHDFKHWLEAERRVLEQYQDRLKKRE